MRNAISQNTLSCCSLAGVPDCPTLAWIFAVLSGRREKRLLHLQALLGGLSTQAPQLLGSHPETGRGSSVCGGSH